MRKHNSKIKISNQNNQFYNNYFLFVYIFIILTLYFFTYYCSFTDILIYLHNIDINEKAEKNLSDDLNMNLDILIQCLESIGLSLRIWGFNMGLTIVMVGIAKIIGNIAVNTTMPLIQKIGMVLSSSIIMGFVYSLLNYMFIMS